MTMILKQHRMRFQHFALCSDFCGQRFWDTIEKKPNRWLKTLQR